MMEDDESLRILIVDSNPERAAVVEAGLSGLSNAQILRANTLIDVNAEIGRLDADVIVVDCDSPNREMFESVREIGPPLALDLELGVFDPFADLIVADARLDPDTALQPQKPTKGALHNFKPLLLVP